MSVRILHGDCREVLGTIPEQSVNCIVTSPPYFGLRDYGVAGQIGLEPTPDAFVTELVAVFRECRRVLKDDGTLWLNLGDSYAGSRCGPQGRLGEMADRSIASQRVLRASDGNHFARPGAKSKDLLMIPAQVALALRADGWYLRSHIIWHKPNPLPESVTDRPTNAHESIFLLSKSKSYWYDADAVRERGSVPRPFLAETRGSGTESLSQGRASRQATGPTGFGTTGVRNLRNVWTVATQPFSEAHFATFPPDLIEPCIKAGCPEKVCPTCGKPWTRFLDPSVEGWRSHCQCGTPAVGGTVLDPFGGAGTTGLVADRLQRNAVLIELNPEYASMARQRIASDAGMFGAVA